MQYDSIELMRKLCDEMGIEWDDAAEALEINGKPIGDDFSFAEVFSANSSFSPIAMPNCLDFTINGLSSHNLKSVNIFDSNKQGVLAA